LGEVASKRLKIMRETEDGFVIAEEDLKLRGAGEVLGTKQSGLPEFRMADLEAHQDLLITAKDDSKIILETDPDLKTERGEALRTLLYLFERDAAIKYLRSGPTDPVFLTLSAHCPGVNPDRHMQPLNS